MTGTAGFVALLCESCGYRKEHPTRMSAVDYALTHRGLKLPARGRLAQPAGKTK